MMRFALLGMTPKRSSKAPLTSRISVLAPDRARGSLDFEDPAYTEGVRRFDEQPSLDLVASWNSVLQKIVQVTRLRVMRVPRTAGSLYPPCVEA